jgi:hypothetical protein
MLAFFDPCLDCIEPGLVEFLRLYDFLNPVFLPLLERLYDVLLIHKMLFVLAKVLSADVLDLVQFPVVFVRQVQALGLGLACDVLYVLGQFVVFLRHLLFDVFP